MKTINKLISTSMLVLFSFNNSFAMNPKSLIVDEIDGFDQFENDKQYSTEEKTKFIMHAAYNMANYNSKALRLGCGIPTPLNSNFYKYKDQGINKTIDSILVNFYDKKSENEQYNVILAHAFTLYKIANYFKLPVMIVLTGYYGGFGDLLTDMAVLFKGKLPGDSSNFESKWISCGLTYSDSDNSNPDRSFKYVDCIYKPIDYNWEHDNEKQSYFTPNKEYYLGENQFVLNLPDSYLNSDVNKKFSDLKIINAKNPENLDDIYLLSKIDLDNEEGKKLIEEIGEENVIIAPFNVKFFLGRCL